MSEMTQERLEALRRTQYSPVEALRQHIDGPGGLRERMDEGNVTAVEVDVVMGYDALQDVIDAQAGEIERLRRIETAAKRVRATHPYDHRRVIGLCDCSLCRLSAVLDGGEVGDGE